jgi:hypothetical protein
MCHDDTKKFKNAKMYKLRNFDTMHRPLTKGRITQQSSPERDESNPFSKNVFLASTENNNLGTEPKFELIWSNG